MAAASGSVPEPDAEARSRSARLLDLLRGEIVTDGRAGGRAGGRVGRAGGWMPFASYMTRALYEPGLGYYSSGARKFGAGGDFITAPELTPLFGQALAAQVEEIMRMSAPRLIEVGAGSGHLIADLLLELERRACPPAYCAILELSADLRARQHETLARRAPHWLPRVEWLDTLPEKFAGVVVANEVLDAMPLHLIVKRAGELFERGVSVSDGALVWADRPASGAVREAALKLDLPDAGGECGEYLTEVNLAAQAWIRTWADRLDRGALLLIDYGYPCAEFYLPSRSRGTLMCYYRHRVHDSPFTWPGLTDITGFVEFTAMAEAGFEAGLDVLGYTSQAHFLLNCGVLDALSRCGPEGSTDYLRAARAVQKLTLPHEMGELFKVMALGRGLNTPLLGFARGDRVHTL
ncbi:MAG: SAM-dependent methyltransferase [Azoarcus sp.]|jgi:SAM-dependent MidA family methyltransferase|nr:SAM-dependent methyltransferase [Azoarcus sp.]